MPCKTISKFNDIIYDDTTYTVDDIYYILSEIKPSIQYSCINTKHKYIDIPCSFDIETSSFFHLSGKEKMKISIMYEWTFGINGYVIIGRTWQEFKRLTNILYNELKLFNNYRLVIYVHNLGYEFQFLRKHFRWEKVFSNKSRQPIYALTTTNIEFRCSYLLSGYKLEKLGENLNKYNMLKLDTLNYDLIRTPYTKLTPEEEEYCVNDVKVVMCFIVEKLEEFKTLANMPLTKTGFVRRYVKNNCFYDNNKSKRESYFKRKRYLDFIKTLTLTVEDYEQMKRAFQGGFTHANAWRVDKTLYNVTSIDFTSSYPFIMVVEKFPMSSPELYELKGNTNSELMHDMKKQFKLYCCVFDIEIKGLKPKYQCENYLSISRCRNVKRPYEVNNGRVVYAESLNTTLTEQDFLILEKFYTWDSLKVYNFKRMKKGYLPKDIVLSILNLYKDKTELKGVAGKETRYMNSKEMINACYGMMVTDIIRKEITYKYGEWKEEKIDANKQIDKYNNDNNRFLYYPWGVWVTAYARRNLFTGIYEFQDDYIYSDTDSLKVLNYEKHKNYVEQYNKNVIEKTRKALDFHKIPFEMSYPKTEDNIPKPLGVWDFDGHYAKFKTLGAKRYMVQYSNDERNKKKIRNKISLTVSGVNKETAVPYLIKKYGDNIFDEFNSSLKIPEEHCGKLTHTYIDDVKEGIVKDYQGNYYQYKELSAVHLSKASYKFSRGKEYADYIKNIQPLD